MEKLSNETSRIKAVKAALQKSKAQLVDCKSIELITFGKTIKVINVKRYQDTDLKDFDLKVNSLEANHPYTYYLPVFKKLTEASYEGATVLFITDGVPTDKIKRLHLLYNKHIVLNNLYQLAYT